MINIYVDPQRVRDCMTTFFMLFNIDPKLQLYGAPIKQIMPYLEKDLANAIINNEEKAVAVLQWLASAVNYCTGETDTLPQIEVEWSIQSQE